MKISSAVSAVVCFAIGSSACVSEPFATQEPAESSAALRLSAGYHVIELSSLGGTRSIGNSLDDLGVVAGQSRLAGNQVVRASVWFAGRQLDLGTLGGSHSSVVWPVKNLRGVISGIAETAEVDPLGEAWSCSAFFPTVTGHVCRGFVWEQGAMRALPTFGGTHGFATGTNDRKQTVGWAENGIRDATCNAPQVLQFRAAVWGPAIGQIRELPPLPGDTTSAATAINDRGQIVGISGICSNAVGEYSAAHAVLWDGDRPTDIGSLGGVAWNTPMAINQRGDVVGFANAAGTDPPNDFNVHAFLWTKRDGIRDLGTLPGDATSQALGINEWRQVVGVSCGATCRAFVWQDGIMTNLNDRVVSGSSDTLRIAGDINDLGEIAGQTVDAANVRSAFLALPKRAH
jgi:probable HAF family extracellular repeat protein